MEISQIHLGRCIAGAALGYLASVVAAAIVSAVCLCLTDASLLRMFGPLVLLAGSYAAAAGAPGFLITVFASAALRLRSPVYFVAAGALNAFLALILVRQAVDSGMFNDLGLACCLGGAAGGLAYWAVARRLGALPAQA